MNVLRWIMDQFHSPTENCAPIPPESSLPDGKYVLVVMYPYYNNFFGVHLDRAGFVVCKRPTIDSAIEQMLMVRPALVVLLIGTIDPLGIELLSAMKSRMELSMIPVLGMVQEKQARLIPEALAASLDECVSVPADVVDYARRVIPI